MTNNEKQMRSTIALRIKEVRIAKGMTQYDLIKALAENGDVDLKQPTISQYEAGNIKVDLITLMAICTALGCSLDYLIGRDVLGDKNSRSGRLLNSFSSMNEDEQELTIRMIEFMCENK